MTNSFLKLLLILCCIIYIIYYILYKQQDYSYIIVILFNFFNLTICILITLIMQYYFHFFVGIYELTHDNNTEHQRTINILERFNVHQEVILAIIYRSFPQSLKVFKINRFTLSTIIGRLVILFFSISNSLTRILLTKK